MTLYIGNLSLDAYPEELHDLISRYGKVKHIERKQGYAFVVSPSISTIMDPVNLPTRLAMVMMDNHDTTQEHGGNGNLYSDKP